MDRLRILIADDHPLFRKGMRNLIEAAGDLELVGEAASGDQAVALAASLQPDVILLDLQMPGGDGIAATREIVNTSPHIRVLVVTLFEDEDSVFAALRSGARGYILKVVDEEEVLRAIRAVGNNEAIFSPAVASRVLTYFASPPVVPRELFPSLTDREREILSQIAEGAANTLIASRLRLSPKTVANHVSNIFSKLQLADRAQAVVLAREAGLGRTERLTPKPGPSATG
jgi:DNA-binding NarL/FixJ family response regulator